MQFFGTCFVVVSAFFTCCLAADPDQSEIDEFIELCDLFSTTMTHCAVGWVELENEMMDSISSFSDRILLTEKLIGEEADEILGMASRIVTTEEMITDMLDTCDCYIGLRSSNTTNSHNSSHHNNISHIGVQYDRGVYPSPHTDHERMTSFSYLGVGNSSLATSVDRCQPMDVMIDVMEEALFAFEAFNDDFLEVLGYMDEAIDAMGDRIVSTECLIMNMSLLIGDMADQIVYVENLMLNATETCCQNVRSKGAVGIIDLLPTHSRENTDDNALRDCDAFLSPVPTISKTPNALRSLMSKASVIVQESRGHSLMRKLVDMHGDIRPSLISKNGQDLRGDPMPCDTWWNPFCCAAEICGDMMVVMMQSMEAGADAMTEMMKGMIDEIGVLADDIVTTEEEIVAMGDRILDMSDMIVDFIDDGIEFAQEFCPVNHEYSRQNFFPNPKSFSVNRPFVPQSTRNSRHVPMHSKQASDLQIFRTHFNTVLTTLASVDTHVKISSRTKVPGGERLTGPMPIDFDEMIQAMVSCVKASETMIAGQMEAATELFKTLNDFITEFNVFTESVDDVDSDISVLLQDMENANDAMEELSSCV